MVAGLLLLTWVGYLTSQSVQMIVEMGRDLNVMDYEKLAEKVSDGFTVVSPVRCESRCVSSCV